jgi:pimeloyl-ACP methyl ester carboxylesterase
MPERTTAGTSVPRAVMNRIEVGTGPAVLLLAGYGLSPRAYVRSAWEVAARCHVRVIVPSLYDLPGSWTSELAADHLSAMLEDLGIERVTSIAHSFSGCAQLAFATKYPDRVDRLIFCDTLAWTRDWPLARQALRPANLLLLATAGAAIDFFRMWISHPVHLAEAAWHGFTGDLHSQIEVVARSGIRSHVLWAQRDTLLRQEDGRAFADELGATFAVVAPRPRGKTVDHNWMYRCPDLFAHQLEQLGLQTWEQSSQVRARTMGDDPRSRTDPYEEVSRPRNANPRRGPRNVTRAQAIERRAPAESADPAGRTT